MFKRIFAFVSLCTIAALAHPLVSAQSEVSAAQARPVFRAGVDVAYVAVDVVVTDKNDKPVTGLKIGDFQVREAGVPQTLIDFDYVLVPPNNRPIDLHEEPEPAMDVASNPPPSRTGRSFVFVIDDGTVKPQDLVPLKRVMTDFLKRLMPDDEAALVYIKRSDLGQDLTHDIGRLVRGVNNINASIGWEPDSRASLEVLNNVLGTLAKAPQARRVIVYVGGGFLICGGPDDLCVTRNEAWWYGDLTALVERAKRADVPIYTLDPHGLASPMDVFGIGGRIEDQTPQNGRAQAARITGWQQFLLAVAGATGGRGFVNQSNLSSAVNQIVADNGSYYVLGFSPSPFVADGKFHPIEVTVSRPNLRVRARQGYVAAKAAAHAVDTASAVMNVLVEGQPQGDLGLRAFAAPMAATSNGAQMVVTLDVSYPAIGRGEVRQDDDLQVAFLAIDSDAGVKVSEVRTRHVAFQRSDGSALSVSLDEVLEVPRGKVSLRIGVSSRLLGRTGTVSLPVEVESLSGRGPHASPLVIGLASPAGSSPTEASSAIESVVPFRPTTRRTFSRDEQLRLFTRVFAGNTADVASVLQLRTGKSVVRTIPLDIMPAPKMPNTIGYEARLSLNDLPVGAYVLEFATRLGPDQPSTRAVAFRVQ